MSNIDRLWQSFGFFLSLIFFKLVEFFSLHCWKKIKKKKYVGYMGLFSLLVMSTLHPTKSFNLLQFLHGAFSNAMVNLNVNGSVNNMKVFGNRGKIWLMSTSPGAQCYLGPMSSWVTMTTSRSATQGEQETGLEVTFPSTRKGIMSPTNKPWITDSTVKCLERRMTEFRTSFLHIRYHTQCRLMVEYSVTIVLRLEDLWCAIFPDNISGQFCRQQRYSEI